MTLSEELQWRGQIKDKTFTDNNWLNEPKTFYLGTDCSSNSLTIGNLAVFMLARRLMDHGWKAVLLVGGATSLIGDPGGKDDERDLKSREEIQNNVEAIKAQVSRLFSGMEFTPADNYDWFKDVGYLEFLRDVGKNYSMSELLQRDFISTRIGEGGSGISYAEFSYSLIQGYDYWQLFKNHGVELQIGGSDQWGNMLSGVPLIRKKENKEVHALSMPLVINKSTGKKFGKSEDGAVWLDPQQTSIYKFYQFWLNVDDEGAGDYLKIYTLLDQEAFDKIMVEFEHDKASRLAQKTLAYEVTKLVHGQERTDSVLRVTEVLFGSADFESLKPEDFDTLATEIPVVELVETSVSGSDGSKSEMVSGALVKAQAASSLGEARRLIEGGGVSVNGKKIQQDTMLTATSLLKKGKNNFVLVR